MAKKLFVLLVLAVATLAQRSPYAGKRPIGYPELQITTTSTTTTVGNELGNRLGEDTNQPSTPRTTTTTIRLPIEALGDRDLIDRLSKMPIDKQPFWFINWQALESHRQKPQTFEQKPPGFSDISRGRFEQLNLF